jgi:tetratricopeptide (TPR) repeat protein
MGLVYLSQDKYDEAERAFNEALANSENGIMAYAGLGHVAARRGRHDEARAVLEDLHRRAETSYVSPVPFTGLYVTLGETDAAFDWLEKAYDERRGWLAYLKIEPLLEGIRYDARFLRLMQRMRLT